MVVSIKIDCYLLTASREPVQRRGRLMFLNKIITELLNVNYAVMVIPMNLKTLTTSSSSVKMSRDSSIRQKLSTGDFAQDFRL